MKFPELCVELARKFGRAPVFDTRYPALGASRAEEAELVLWQHEGFYDVGGVERGEWTSVVKFVDEASACQYILEALSRSASTVRSSTEDNQRSAKISADFNAELKGRLGL